MIDYEKYQKSRTGGGSRCPESGHRASFRNWTTTQRRSFANDLGEFRSLVAVTDNVYQAKATRTRRPGCRRTHRPGAATSASGWL